MQFTAKCYPQVGTFIEGPCSQKIEFTLNDIKENPFKCKSVRFIKKSFLLGMKVQR